jgi:hypothetical protein
MHRGRENPDTDPVVIIPMIFISPGVLWFFFLPDSGLSLILPVGDNAAGSEASRGSSGKVESK